MYVRCTKAVRTLVFPLLQFTPPQSTDNDNEYAGQKETQKEGGKSYCIAFI
jgi:hypothetical protein